MDLLNLLNLKDITFLVIGMVSWYAVYHSIWVGESEMKSKLIFGSIAVMCCILIFKYNKINHTINDVAWYCFLNVILAESKKIKYTKYKNMIYRFSIVFFVSTTLYIHFGDFTHETLTRISTILDVMKIATIGICVFTIKFKPLMFSVIFVGISTISLMWCSCCGEINYDWVCWFLYLSSHLYLVGAMIYKLNDNKKRGLYEHKY